MRGRPLAVAVLTLAVSACSADYAPVSGRTLIGPNHTYIAEAPGSGLPTRVEGPLLQACADQASAAQEKQNGSDFMFLRLDSANLKATAVRHYVGKHYVNARLDGQGAWWGHNDEGAGEYRAVTFSCLLNKSGAVYTLVQAQ